MRARSIFGLLLCLLVTARLCSGQAPAASASPSPGVRALDEMTSFLLGDWVGEGSGAPGEGTGRFTFERSLAGNIVVRRSHSEYPAAEGRPATVHDDLMVLYPDGRQIRADYFDNEGHVIHYTAAFVYATGVVVFDSDATAGQPRYRLTYTPLSKDRVSIVFEIAPPDKPGTFAPYVKGTARRAPAAR